MQRAAIAFFFLSGVSGLLYEVAWIRTAGTVIGNTTYAVGTVVGVYMAGLGLGAWLGGRAADRRTGARLLRLYGLLEAGVAVAALAVPLLLRGSEPLFRVLWNSIGEIAPLYAACRVALVAAVLLAPTALMGATLPVLARFLSSSAEDAPRRAGTAYAVNTFGGVAGTLAAGFWLVPSFGLRATTLAAAGINLAIAAGSLLLARGQGGEVRPAPAPEPPPPRLPLLAAGLSGLTSLLYEVAWTRSLILSFGSTVYAFTLILTAFILGLAAGSALSARFLLRRAPRPALAAVQTAAGTAALALLPFLGDLPLRLAPMVQSLRDRYETLLLAEFGLVALFVFLPTLALGAVFPLACRWAGGSEAAVGRSVAAVYAWNTAGSIAGTLLGSFVLVPFAGLSATIVLAATVNLALAAGLFRSRLSALPAAAGVLGGILFLAAPWDPQVLASGAFLYSGEHARSTRDFTSSLRAHLARDTELLARYWDSYGLVTVHRQKSGILTMRVNGKTDASTGPSDTATMHFVGHVPALHPPAPRRGLVIGLGGGLTLAALARHPFERIDCVEISPAVARASAFFESANARVLSDPRVRLVLGDGRNAILFGRDPYDVIVSQPSNLWISGMASLFTREFFREASRRLAPGGVFCQWVHAYKLDTESLREVFRTFFDVFPHGSVWEIFPGHDYFFLGFLDEPRISFGDLEARLRATGALAEHLGGTGGAAGLLRHLVTDAAGARRAAGEGPLITDDHCAIEFAAPRALYRDPRPGTLLWLDGVRRDLPGERVYRGGAAAYAEREGRRQVAEAVRWAAEGSPLEAIQRLEDVRNRLGRDPRTQVFFDLLCEQLIEAAVGRVTGGNAEGAVRLLRAVPRSSARHGEARYELGEIFLLAGRARDAAAAFEEAAGGDSYFAAAARARLEELARNFAGAAAAWEAAVRLDPGYAPGWFEMALCLARAGRPDDARKACRESLRLDPGNEPARKLLEELNRR